MSANNVASYAIWFSIADGNPKTRASKMEAALQALWEATLKYYTAEPSRARATARFEPYVHVGANFYLLHTETHFSPGDIGGFPKHNELLGPEDDVVAIRIDRGWYIPHHGFADQKRGEELNTWKRQADDFYFENRARS
ncbi:hypothetical protein [Caballeronia sp. Lep1P3]|uniref:hypothetical protein n=1 Tax=Burkholderiaceae TaxID=119060 RepID=UPI001FD43EC0|nr:hypothetical protein [Caballeronia sp. Lep1P3]